MEQQKQNQKIRRYPPKMDIIFQAIFGEVGSENITKDFLEKILKRKIEKISLDKNPILRRELKDDKLGVLDIVTELDGKEKCNIEMQLIDKSNIIERMLYYWSKMYTRQIKAGDDYKKLEKTIVILIADFNIKGLEEVEYHSTWKIIETNSVKKLILTDKFELDIIELLKIKGRENEKDQLLDWLIFLENPESERVTRKMEENENLKEAVEKLDRISEDEKMQRIIELREKAIRDEHAIYDKGLDDGIEKGIQKGFEEGKNLKIDYQNAQGDISIAKTISDQFVTSNVDMIFAIATSSLQASYNATKDIPIVFTAVTDPIEAGVAKSWESSDTNVTGTSDMVSMEEQLNLLITLVPDIKTVGVIYNSSEANSLAQVQELKKEADKKGIDIKEISVTTVNEINQNLNSAIGSIDALYAPTDNTVASAYDLVGNICVNKKVPILCGEEAGVSKGGLCSIGIDYFKLGKEAGYKAAEILNGTEPSDIKITTLSDMSITINTDVAEKLNITIPEDIDAKANKVTGGVQ